MSHSKIPERWQRIAWAIGAHDLATDMDDSDPEFTAWAEVAHGGTARLALAIAQVINDTAPVHNHGPAEGRGLNCPEPVVNGRLRGACITTSPEPDPWPTAPLIVATFLGKRCVFGRTDVESYDSPTGGLEAWPESATLATLPPDTLTDVVPVTVVPTAEWEALGEKVRGFDTARTEKQRRVVVTRAAELLIEATNALGLD